MKRICGALWCLVFLLPSCTRAAGVTLVIGEPGGTIRPLLGVNAGPVAETRQGEFFDATAWYRRIGVAGVRTHDFYGYLDMSTLYPDQNADPSSPSSYNFEASDRMFLAILAGGFEPYLRLGDSWNSGAQFPSPKARAPTNRANWTRAAVEVVRHYRALAGSRLRYVEIWNEPDHRQFWDASPHEFHVLFDETARALKTEFPELRIGGPGFTAAAVLLPKGRFVVESFLDYLQKRQTPLDFLSWHLYSNDPNVFADAARFYRKELNDRGFRKVESHLTEYNTDERRRPPGISAPELRLGGMGASVMSAAWIALQNENVEAAFFYRGTDLSVDQPGFYGMFRANGVPKRTALGFSFWSRLAGCSRRLTVTVLETDQPPLWMLAGKTPSGDIQLLISNPSPQEVRWNISSAGGRTVSGLIIEEISDAAEPVVTRRAPDNRALTPGHSVQLVTVKTGG